MKLKLSILSACLKMKFYIEVVVIAIEMVNIKKLSFKNENLD